MSNDFDGVQAPMSPVRPQNVLRTDVTINLREAR
jgi:hypothetical protein